VNSSIARLLEVGNCWDIGLLNWLRLPVHDDRRRDDSQHGQGYNPNPNSYEGQYGGNDYSNPHYPTHNY
jgi:hypothetical protein